MAIVQAKAVDNGNPGTTTLPNTYPGTCSASNYRFKIVCPRGNVNSSSVVESPGAVAMAKQTTNITDPDFVGNNHIQCWAPSSFTATTSGLTTLASSTPGIEFFFEDDEIDPAVGFLGGQLKDNSAGANPLTTDAKAFTGDVVVYEVTTSGGGSSLGFGNGGGPSTPVTGTNVSSGHHGNTGDGDDMYVQRRVINSVGAISAQIGNPGVASCNTALFVFRKRAGAPAGVGDDDQVIEG